MAAATPRANAASSTLDDIVIGNSSSEHQHQLTDDHSQLITGGLDQPARELLPLNPATFDGGWIAFKLKVDPHEQNYLTVKLWGSDKGETHGRLVLYANGLQVGYRHEGDYDILNQCDEEGEAPGRFFYQTVPLPPSLTRDKNTLDLKIAALGAMWPYGSTFDKYQKNLTQPSRGIYRVYTHADGRFVPDDSEKQGTMPEAHFRTDPGEPVIADSKKIVIDRITRLLEKPPAVDHSGNIKEVNGRFLLYADAYNTQWTPAWHDARMIDQIAAEADAMAQQQTVKPNYVEQDWPGAGPLGEAIMRTWPALSDRLDQQLTVDGKSIARRDAWTHLLRASVDYWRTHRRSYTNQSMIVDRNIYTANRALELIAPKMALPEQQALHYLYQAVGIEPWLGSDPRDDGQRVADTPDQGSAKPYGDNYYLVTRKHLSRELGWVATYGETILHFTCDIAKLTGDEKIRQQLANLEHARMYFRYPGLDEDGYRCMKLVSEVDNRTAHYPLSGSAYGVPNIREEWWMDVPALLSDDPVAVGAAQQSIEEGQYFAYVNRRLKDPDTLGMMRNVDEYQKVKSLPASSYRLPMTESQPDFVFSDEQDAIVVIKHGETKLFANMYYRAERAVNGVSRVYELTPTFTRIATVQTQTQVTPSGKTYTRPDWIDGIRSHGMPPPGEAIHQAWAGEQMPVALRPSGATLPQYDNWGPFLGRADFYQLRFGDYLIEMNSSDDREFTLSVPAEFSRSHDLISGKSADELAKQPMKPLSTVVLCNH